MLWETTPLQVTVSAFPCTRVIARLGHLTGQLQLSQYINTRGMDGSMSDFTTVLSSCYWTFIQLTYYVTYQSFEAANRLLTQLKQLKLCFLASPKMCVSCPSTRRVDTYIIGFFLLQIYAMDDFRVNAPCRDCGARAEHGG